MRISIQMERRRRWVWVNRHRLLTWLVLLAWWSIAAALVISLLIWVAS